MTTTADQNAATLPYLHPDLPIAERVRDLIGRMTLEEKASQMLNVAPGIERLGIPPYDWWNECLHGVGRAGIATVFPQSIGMAAMWDDDLMHRIAVSISDEARAKHHHAMQKGFHGRSFGLTYWTPNINIFRDPRWGRGQETYGEDPWLTTRMGVAFVKGLQGNDDRYLKLVATPKHFAVHSGPEANRHQFDAKATVRDMVETYFPAFKACVQEANAASVMGAYNRLNGEACCASPFLLQQVLRDAWGFDGYVVSDCGAIEDIYEHHKLFRIKESAVAFAVKAGCDLCCGEAYDALVGAVQQGYLSEADIDRSLERLFVARFKLGMFDPPARVPYAQIPYEVVNCPAHQELALQAARESLVLLKNEGNLLPLKLANQYIGVLGPNANAPDTLVGNYNGNPARAITPLEGIIARAFPQANIMYHEACPLVGQADTVMWEAMEIIRDADMFIIVGGLSVAVESEEGPTSGDRISLDLPASQRALLEKVHATGKPYVVVLLNGSAVAGAWAEQAPAILEAWYPGEAGGTAIAEALFGDYNPGGRLPVTFYQSVEQLPDFEDYHMPGHTYRYFTGTPLFPFGYGLSYTTFTYGNLQVQTGNVAAGETVTVSVEVRNSGDRAGDEVVQLYVSDIEASVPVAIRNLQGFRRIHLAAGETQTVTFTLQPDQFMVTADDGTRFLEPGAFRISVGGGQPGCTPEHQMVETTIEIG